MHEGRFFVQAVVVNLFAGSSSSGLPAFCLQQRFDRNTYIRVSFH